MKTEIKNNSIENNLLRCLFSLEGCTLYSLLNADDHPKTGKVLRLFVDKMCRTLTAVGNATTTKQEQQREKKKRGAGLKTHLKWVLCNNKVAW